MDILIIQINSRPTGVLHHGCANSTLQSIALAFLGCAQHDLSEEQYWLMIAKASECAGDLNQKAQTHHFEKWLLWKERAFQREIFRVNIKSI